MSLALARVAAVHPNDHSVDLVMVDDGARLSGVQVLTWNGSSDCGTHDLPTPATPASGDKWSLTERTSRDMIAVVGYVGIMPVVVGFLYPQVSQMLFKDPNMRVMRHASDVYSVIDGQGNVELAHPSGLYIRIGTDPAHQDLAGKDVDGKWAIDKNTGSQVHLHLELPGKWSVDIEPSAGNIVLDTHGTVDATAAGDVTVKAPKVTLDTPETHLTGNLQIDGTFIVGGAGGGAAGAITGDLSVTGKVAAGGDVTSGGNVTATGTVHGSNI